MDDRGGTGEAMLWRLLRIGSAPYFVLGSSADRSLRLRIATSWDWRQHFQLIAIAMEGQPGGQPRVGWEAVVRDRTSHEVHSVVRAHRSALEPRPLRRAPRGQGLPRHAAPPRAGVLHPAMSDFDPTAFTPPLRVPELVRRRSCCAPTPSPTSPWCARRRPIRSSLPSRPCRATYTDDAGRAFIARQHARAHRGRRLSPSSLHASPSRGRASDPSGCGCRRSRAGAPPSATGSSPTARGHGLAAARPAWPSWRSPSGRWPSRACTSSSSPGTWRRPARPKPPVSAARGDAARLGAHRRRAARRRLLRPPAFGVGPA